MASLAQMPNTNNLTANDLFLNYVQPSPFCRPFQQLRPSANETRKVVFHNDVNFGTQAAILVPHEGDLLVGATLEVKLKKLPNEFPTSLAGYYPVEALVKRVAIDVGGTFVDSHTSNWLRLYDEYVRTPEESRNYRRMANFDPDTLTTAVECTETLCLPLVFSFFRDRRTALPLAGLRNVPVRIVFDFATAAEVGVNPEVFEAALYVDYTMVDPGVRQWLSTTRIPIMVEQVQWNGGQLVDAAQDEAHTNVRAKLAFRRPTKALFWVLEEYDAQLPDRTMHGRWVGDPVNTYLSLQPSQYDFGGFGLVQSISEKLAPVRRVRLLFNTRDRFSARLGKWFNENQSAQHCRRAPLPGSYMYAFSDDVPSLQPTPGLCNMSNFNDVQLMLQLKKNTRAPVTDIAAYNGDRAEDYATNIDGLRNLHVFAWSYNVCFVHAGSFGMLLND